MAGLQIETPPQSEPLLLSDVKNFLRVDFSDDDALISSLVTASRELVEGFTARSLVNKGYIQVLDSFPYFTDTVMSQMAFPPSYYSLPRFSTTLWNYSQMIKLLVSPLVAVSKIVYLGTDSQYHTLLPGSAPWRPLTQYAKGVTALDGNGNLQTTQGAGTSDSQPPNAGTSGVSGSQQSGVSWATNIGGTTVEATGLVWLNIGPATLNPLAPGNVNSNTFFSDAVSEPPRLFPGPAGSFWPPVMYVPNAVEIHFIAGYGNPVATGSPASFVPPTPSPDGIWDKCTTAMKMLVAGWYEHRESISPLNLREMPNHVKALLWNARVLDFQPTRG